ncbi:TIE1 [Branchiostoma lanceolatum]|uniref:TIE1 protein n=1 Tax=Branchiostoma lanceolatum TaxID=7740 RepID=A0A8J9Z018_BRALA|nr:TIE1 [Branchiostoma lanceolatum]
MRHLLKVLAGVTLLFASCHAGRKTYSIAVSESADPGHVILCLRGGIDKKTYRISDGNKDDRFAIDRDSGNLYVKRYLNFDIDSHYEVMVTNDHNGDELRLLISVIDDPSYPPVFNPTCHIPPRARNDSSVWPFMVRVSSIFGYKLLYSDGKRHGQRSSAYLNNDQCEAKVFVVMRDKFLTTQIPPGTTPVFQFSCTNIRDPTRGTLTATPYWNASYDRPQDDAIDPEWFVNPASSRYGERRHVLLEVDMTDIITEDLTVFNCRLEFETATGFSVISEGKLAFDPIGCPAGYYGGTCRNVCVCQNGGNCHPFNGACKCPDGWTGRACDIVDPKIVISANHGDVMPGQTVQISCAVVNVDPSSTFAWARNGRQLLPSDGVKTMTSRGFDVGMNRTFVNSTIITNISTLADSGEYACAYVTSSGKLYRESAQVALEGTFSPDCINCFSQGRPYRAETIALCVMSTLAISLIVAMATQCEINRRKRKDGKAVPTAGRPRSVPDIKERTVQFPNLIARGAVENEYVV